MRPEGIWHHGLLLRMRDDIVEMVGVPLDGEVEPPVVIHSSLPETGGLAVFLGARRRMPQIAQEAPKLFAEILCICSGASRKDFVKRAENRTVIAPCGGLS
jgi:hypothetical protein